MGCLSLVVENFGIVLDIAGRRAEGLIEESCFRIIFVVVGVKGGKVAIAVVFRRSVLGSRKERRIRYV